jgi:hypothetical protein
MTNPYADAPNIAFWSRAVAGRGPFGVDPAGEPPFAIGPRDAVATAGSCFAQHIAGALAARGYRYLVTETGPENGSDASYGVFPARFGNIYTVRQLLQTFDRAYGLYRPQETAWRRADGAWVDPFRPRVEAAGFATLEALEADRRGHLAAVRRMFEDCDVFIFTLGLTEAWRAKADGAVFPLAPGVAGGDFDPALHEFHNFEPEEMTADLRAFLGKLRTVNPRARVILTVSPVPLIATAADRHVLLSNTYSKAALRVTAEAVARREPDVAYFPSYEIITGPQTAGRFFAEDLRSVTAEGVAHVMDIFAGSFLREHTSIERGDRPAAPVPLSDHARAAYARAADVVCDEEAIES